MPVDFVIPYCKTKLEPLDYGNRLKQIYEWVKTGYVNLNQFRILIDYIVNLDLLPSED